LPKYKIVAAIALGAWFLALLWNENRRPLRIATENKGDRLVRNGLIAACGAVVIQLLETPLANQASRLTEKRKFGLLNHLKLPETIKTVCSVILLDYTLYIWHYLSHKIPLLWRFHVVHHIDLDLDASTALRFHFGELAISVLWRVSQITVLGINPRALLIWQDCLLASILFHHSNIKLPRRFETLVNRFVVTPRMHGIHHSIIQDETDSNWSSGLTIWDKLHGTYRADDPQVEVIIGVPAYRKTDGVRLFDMITLPFKRQKPTWSFSFNPSQEAAEGSKVENV
jgi:sterol desaturase/sphingolipid hydroxylase (fatty acid hydroxylase superfamily)